MSQFFKPPEGEEQEHSYHTRLEKKVNYFFSPFEQFTRSQISASILLLLCTIIALAWATIPAVSESYQRFVHLLMGIFIGKFVLKQSLRFWVNDLLLTLFFFFVGLEIKREFLVGELRNRKRAVLVNIAALGGMIMPALIYILFNHDSPNIKGWGIPIATDTAFTIGILSCFRSKLPKGVFTFMAALAIIDDIGAILVIAIFYTKNLHLDFILIALSLVMLLVIFNLAGFRRITPYLVIGLIAWGFVEASGIHGTIAGITVAFTVPARPKRGPKQFLRKSKRLIRYFEQRRQDTALILKDEQQHITLKQLQDITEEATTPLQRWESALQTPISIFVLPVFALVNAGVPLNASLFESIFRHPAALGIFFGLVVGKPLGISLFSRIAIWLKLGSLPSETYFKHIVSIALLAGIGFTMSFFMGNLAFHVQPNLLRVTKASILLGSFIAGILGFISLFLLRKTSKQLQQ